MLHIILGSVGTFMSFLGILANLYVLVVLLRSKKARSSNELILLHLSSCGLASSLTNLFCVNPSVFVQRWVAVESLGCNITGATTLSFQLLIVWSICALSADRCTAIVSPLRYTQVVTRRKIAAFFLSVWVITISFVLVSFIAIKSTPSDIPSEIGESGLSGILPPHIVQFPEEGYHHHDNNEAVSPASVSSYATPYISNLPTSSNIFVEHVGSNEDVLTDTATMGYISNSHDTLMTHHITGIPVGAGDNRSHHHSGPYQYRPLMGLCLPKLSSLALTSGLWVGGWITLILIAPMITLFICDFTVLSIARKQRHRIILALYQITAVTQVTVTGSKGTPLPGLWMNRSVPAKSRACRAVWEDLTTLAILHLPLILIFILESVLDSHTAPLPLDTIASLSLFATPSLTAALYGIRARPLRAAYKSYLRKRLTNSTLQHEIQQRLSPVDGSPRLSGSRIKSFRSSSPSPNSSPIMTPRRQSTNDLRPPPIQLAMSISPSHGNLGCSNHHHHTPNHLNKNDGMGGGNGNGNNKRKVRSYLHIPSQVDMQEFWSGLTRPNRSPTIVITHEIRLKDSSSNSLCSQPPSPAAEQRL